ncbi:HisA/HisF-related TIM barrel protein [Candidatus Hodgkinia cicadicola]
MITSIDKDGTNDGYDVPLLKAVSSLVSVPIIDSGGNGDLRHIYRKAIIEGGASSVLLASSLHYNKFSIITN